MSSSLWSPYKQDVEKIIHAKAYRRYSDKTQVVYLVENDHLTSRGLHVQLVSSYARGLGKQLGLDEDLIEAIALGHDVGHPPFGHEGEGYLSALSKSLGLQAFSHSLQSVRLFRDIEPLNLTLQTLDGFLCHDGGDKGSIIEVQSGKTLEMHEEECLRRKIQPEENILPMTLEGALVKLCDTLCYIGQDIEDAVSLGIIDEKEVPVTALGGSNSEILLHVGLDLLENSRGQKAIALSDKVFKALMLLREFNFDRIYTHQALKVESQKISSGYKLLLDYLLEDFEKRGEESDLYVHFLHSKEEKYIQENSREQYTIDFIAGMTDNYFVTMLERIFVPQKIIL